MNIKNYFKDYQKAMIIFIAFIFVFVFAMFTPENYANSQNEVIFIVLVAICGLFSIYFSYKNKLKLHNVALSFNNYVWFVADFFHTSFEFYR